MATPNYKVKVVCRVRPFLKHESPDTSVQVDANSIKITNQRNTTEILKYSFSSCYGPEAKQPEIFQNDVRPLVEHVFGGLDATIFAYGVTGSGKTHTMQGADIDPGIIPRTVRLLFEKRRRSKKSVEFKVSYMEIYKESVFDLFILRDLQSPAGLPIREDGSRNIFVANLSEKEITSIDDFDRIYSTACKNRSVASTKLNEQSSRSHAILCIQVIVRDPTDPTRTLTGKINLIDLAGSEDNRRTENGRERMAESGAINRSLFVLGQVVEALNLGSTRVPYRDSKMTRILQPSLGGKSLGMMIINIAPGQSFYMDTYNTLNFATKSKEIENKPIVNEVVDTKPTRAPLSSHTSLGKPLRAAVLVQDGTAASLRGKRRSDSSFETGRPTKRPATQIDRSFSSDTGVTAAERRPLAAKPIRPVNRIVGNAEKEKEKGVPKDWREVRKEKEEKELEKKVARIVEKQMKEMSEKGKILSPLLKKHQTEVQSRLESLEQKLDVKTDSEIALMLTPETKTKTALAHARLGKKAEKQAQYQGALEHYEKALLFMPDNSRLQVKMQEVKDLMNGVSKPKRRREKENQQRSPANDDDHGGEHDLGNTTLISNTSTSIMTVSAGFLEDSQHSPFVASTSASPVVLTAPVAVPLTEEQIEQIAAELVRIVNTGVVKRIKGIRGVGAKRAAQIVDFVKERGAITEVGELVDAGLSIAVVNGLVRSNRGLIEVA